MTRGLLRHRTATAGLAMVAATLTGCFTSPPQIISLQPDRGSVGVPADAPIVVQFDRAVVRSSVSGRFTVAPSIDGCDLATAFQAAPSAGCRVVWASDSTRFTLEHPGAVLTSNTRYTFTLVSGFADVSGVVNTVDHRWDITTQAAPEVRAITPSQGATAVPADAPLVVGFSTTMDAVSTERAITLTPGVPDTRVAPSRDHSRYLVLPGHPLVAGTTYRLSVADTATDEHGERLLAPAAATFTAGTLSAGDHAVVLASRPGEPASQVALALLAAQAAGDPLAAETVLTAPRCAGPSACGRVAPGSLLYSYTGAALSQDARWLAVVEQDRTTTASSLVVLNPATGSVNAVIAGASLPAWSPDGSTLAMARAGAVTLYRPASGVTSRLPPGDPLLQAPRWGQHDEILALATGSPSAQHVEIGDAVLLARYPVPNLAGLAADPALSPDGTQLALSRSGAGVAGLWVSGLGSTGAQPRRLDARLRPVGWADAGTLLAAAPQANGAFGLVAVTVATGEQSAISIVLSAATLRTLSIAPTGRLLAYLAAGAAGLSEAVVQNSDGSGLVPLSLPGAGSLDAAGVWLS